jgi:hypothetical protein
MSQRLGWISADDRDRAVRLFIAAGLPVVPPAEMSANDFLQHMAVDKKVLDGQLRLVLLRQLGEAVVIAEQVGEPGATKGPMERAVSRIVTPGTLTDAALLDDRRDALLLSANGPGLEEVFAKARAARMAWGERYVNDANGGGSDE